MKFAKEATTKNGRRTWKVTYELVRGPEPKPKRRAEKAATATAPPGSRKIEAKKNTSAKSQPKKPETKIAKRKKRRARRDQAQLGLF